MTTAAVSPSPRIAPFRALPTDHLFFSGIALAGAVVIVGGFANTYGPKVMSGNPQVPSVIHLHAAVFATWLVVFVTQNVLVLRGRTDVHRTLGPWAVALAGVMLIVGSAAAVVVTRAGSRGIPGVEFPDPGGFLLLNLMDITIFFALVLAGWYARRDPQKHKRLMLMAVMGTLIGPGASRLPFATGKPGVIAPIVLAFMLAGIVYDLVTRRRVHPAYYWSVPLTAVALPPIVEALAATPIWHAVAGWILG